MDLQTAFDRGFEAVKSYIDAELAARDARHDAQIAELKALVAAMKHQGIWNAQKVYTVGNYVTDHGSTWCCTEACVGARPGSSDAWQLAAKRGSDGKDVRR